MMHLDDLRVRRHFDDVLDELGARPPRHDAATSAVRRFVFAELRRYRDAVQFPRNYYERARTPVFIDEHGTRCAMAHLLEACGFRDLVQRIAREKKYARIRELEGDPELLLALAAMGLTVDEAARIQPSYEQRCTDGAGCFCQTFGGRVVAALTAKVETTTTTSTKVRVSAIEGTTTVKVGDLVELEGAGTVGATLLVAERITDAGVVRSTAHMVGEKGQVGCNWSETTATSSVVAKAMVSSDCAAVLAASYPAWDCSNEKQTCGLHGAGDVGGVSLIVALSIVAARLRS